MAGAWARLRQWNRMVSVLRFMARPSYAVVVSSGAGLRQAQGRAVHFRTHARFLVQTFRMISDSASSALYFESRVNVWHDGIELSPEFGRNVHKPAPCLEVVAGCACPRSWLDC